MNRQRVAELFDQVIELPIGERAAWIAAACVGDDALRAELGDLDEAHALTTEIDPLLKTSSSPYAADLRTRLASH